MYIFIAVNHVMRTTPTPKEEERAHYPWPSLDRMYSKKDRTQIFYILRYLPTYLCLPMLNYLLISRMKPSAVSSIPYNFVIQRSDMIKRDALPDLDFMVIFLYSQDFIIRFILRVEYFCKRYGG